MNYVRWQGGEKKSEKTKKKKEKKKGGGPFFSVLYLFLYTLQNLKIIVKEY